MAPPDGPAAFLRYVKEPSMDPIYKHVMNGFREKSAERTERRIGAELKFPLVNADGSAASYAVLTRFWDFLAERGWAPVRDTVSGSVIGATRPGEQNDTVASCETGYCKLEFSMAHTADLNVLQGVVDNLRGDLRTFCNEHDVHIIGFGIHPVTPPCKDLLMKKKARTKVWDKVFGANRVLPEADGDDMCLFTVNSASHVHVSVNEDEAVPAINVLNGFSGAQIALTANSNIWRGRIDPDYKCVSEKFWDWWIPEPGRTGVPDHPFESLKDYVETVSGFQPVFVMRNGQPIVLKDFDSFQEFFHAEPARGVNLDGDEVTLTPDHADIDLHSTTYWFNARLSRYFTVENRINDQQPPDELLCIAALTSGLIETLGESHEAIRAWNWDTLRRGRDDACRRGIAPSSNGHGDEPVDLERLATEMLQLADEGLKRRGLGEEKFLEPLHRRLERRECPADDAARAFEQGGIEALIAQRQI